MNDLEQTKLIDQNTNHLCNLIKDLYGEPEFWLREAIRGTMQFTVHMTLILDCSQRLKEIGKRRQDV